eukprot:scaffold23520_cov202-Skeletonema_marinoi.AAC.10
MQKQETRPKQGHCVGTECTAAEFLAKLAKIAAAIGKLDAPNGTRPSHREAKILIEVDHCIVPRMHHSILHRRWRLGA